MRRTLRCLLGLVFAVGAGSAGPGADEGIRWLVEYDGTKRPGPEWSVRGEPKATLGDGALHVVDDSNQEGCFRAPWTAEPGAEIVVEARVKVGAIKASRGGQSVWPWRDGAPVGLLVSDGRHQEGICLTPRSVATFTDRFWPMNTTSAFHEYRLVIRGGDMSVSVDGECRIRGAGAFWKPADEPEPFVQFGSSAKAFTGDAQWACVRLGVRKAGPAAKRPELKITISEPWEIRRKDKVRQTRPYLYNMGSGLLLMSVAQGPDAYYEPYGVLKSTDEGKTWSPIAGLDQIEFAPQPMIRLKDGTIVGVSRWNHRQGDGVLVGRTVHFDERAEQFTLFENRIEPGPDVMAAKGKGVLVFDRHIFEQPDGSILAVVYGHATRGRGAWLLRSADKGRTWRPFSRIADANEPGVARFSLTEMTAVLRQSGMQPLRQTWSHDGGRTWSEPVVLEEGSVDPDLEVMHDGVLACSYGRPASCLMFSLDRGKTWTSHRVVSADAGFNYTSVREIRPGRLLYVHDAPTMRAVYVDVERANE